MNIKEDFKNKRNVATFTFILIITVILTLYIATSHSRYVLEKELKFDLNIIESEEWNKRTLITGENLNDILLSSGATQVIFGYKDDYAEAIKDIEGTAVGLADEAKSFAADDIKLYTVTDSEDIKTALILSKYQIKANADSAKMFYSYETLTNVIFSNFETTILENADSMFYGCKNLVELDLYKFETPKLTNISNMFYDCNLLKTIYVSELWNLSEITEVQENVFYNCESLIGGNGTTYDAEKPIITSEYACVDTKETTDTAAIPGYFTYKKSDTEEEPITFNLVRPNANEKTDTDNTPNNNEQTNNGNETDTNKDIQDDKKETKTETNTENNTETKEDDLETETETETDTENNTGAKEDDLETETETETDTKNDTETSEDDLENETETEDITTE